MKVLAIIIFIFLAVSKTLSDSIASKGEASLETTGQSLSVFLMKEIFKLDGILQEIKTTQLKRLEDDVEELKANQHEDQPSSNSAVEALRREIEVLKEDNKRMQENSERKNQEIKAEVEHLIKENELIKNLHLDTTISKLQEKDRVLESVITGLRSSKNGVTYVRWGRTVCPGDSETVYSGYVGGVHYTHSGSGSNILCLTSSPEYGQHEDTSSGGALVYGGEYEFGDFQRDGGSEFFGTNLNDKDALCVVCRPPRPSVVMIPGKRTCYSGWTLEYRGYLVADYYGHASSSEFICLDDRPEPRAGSGSNNDGKTIYMAVGICGSLPCPPYINGRQITCVVCSK